MTSKRGPDVFLAAISVLQKKEDFGQETTQTERTCEQRAAASVSKVVIREQTGVSEEGLRPHHRVPDPCPMS